MLRFRNLASSSAGNATLIEAADSARRTRVLVDCGVSLRQLEAALADEAIEPGQIDAVFITHEHADHIGCALACSRRHQIPLWMSAGTREAIEARNNDDIHLAADGRAIEIGALRIDPFTVPHDAREPLQLTCTDGTRRLGIATDLGHVTPHVLRQLAGCHTIMLESNHDGELLRNSRYPGFLKRRIAGPLGHLSNAQAAQVLGALALPTLKRVIASHLSESNNDPALVREALAGASHGAKRDILVSGRHGLDWIRL